MVCLALTKTITMKDMLTSSIQQSLLEKFINLHVF